MNREILNLIQQRREEGRTVVNKVRNIVIELGESTPKKYGNNHSYSYKGILINYDDYGANMSVTYNNGKDIITVLSLHLGEIEAYRPDIPEWLFSVDEIYPVVEQKIREKMSTKDAKEKQELMDKWGITT